MSVATRRGGLSDLVGSMEPGVMIAVDDPITLAMRAVAQSMSEQQDRDIHEAFANAAAFGSGQWRVLHDKEYKENDVKTPEQRSSFAHCDEGHKRYIEPQERAFYLARCTEPGCNKFLKAGTALESTKQDGPAKSKKQAVNP